MLKDASTYQIIDPERIGYTRRRTYPLGKTSGRNAFVDRCKNLGLGEMTKEQVTAAFDVYKGLFETRKDVSDDDVVRVVNEVN
jgi:2-isopropylmalate synthase